MIISQKLSIINREFAEALKGIQMSTRALTLYDNLGVFPASSQDFMLIFILFLPHKKKLSVSKLVHA